MTKWPGWLLATLCEVCDAGKQPKTIWRLMQACIYGNYHPGSQKYAMAII